MKTIIARTIALLTLVAASAARAEPPTFQILIPPLTEGGPFTGRLILHFIDRGSTVSPEFLPSDGPFFNDPQPMYSAYIENAQPGDTFIFVPDQAFPVPFEQFPAGSYEMQAIFDREMSHSSWRKEVSNLYSPKRQFKHSPSDPAFVSIPLLNNSDISLLRFPIVETFETRSDLLSDFFGEDVTLRAGVVFPINYNPERSYPAVYHIPGFPIAGEVGGDFRDAYIQAAIRERKPHQVSDFWKDAFYIVLDHQGPFGPHLFADSANNGPVGRALLEELLPAIEAEYPLIARPEARLLRGQSSGGWAVIWLQMHHPDVFGGAWASAPDPVDFRAFQTFSVYDSPNAFTDLDGNDTASYREGGQVKMTTREENAMERVMGPEGQSSQQWSSWNAVFSPRGDLTWLGYRLPRQLFDLRTGEIDSSVAEHWRKYDISALVRENPEKFGPVFRDRIRIIAGEQDNFYLNRAVDLLTQALIDARVGRGNGFITIIPGADHAVITPELEDGILNDMRKHLVDSGVLQPE